VCFVMDGRNTGAYAETDSVRDDMGKMLGFGERCDGGAVVLL